VKPCVPWCSLSLCAAQQTLVALFIPCACPPSHSTGQGAGRQRFGRAAEQWRASGRGALGGSRCVVVIRQAIPQQMTGLAVTTARMHAAHCPNGNSSLFPTTSTLPNLSPQWAPFRPSLRRTLRSSRNSWTTRGVSRRRAQRARASSGGGSGAAEVRSRHVIGVMRSWPWPLADEASPVRSKPLRKATVGTAA
jgi:hypothetical protein